MKPAIVVFSFLLGSLASAQPSSAASSADQLCSNVLLKRQEQDLCRQQVAAAQTMDELKQIQAKFRDRIKAAEEASKGKK